MFDLGAGAVGCPRAGGTRVRVAGGNCGGDMRGRFGDNEPVPAAVESDASLTCVSPPHDVPLTGLKLEVTANGGDFTEHGLRFGYRAAARVLDVQKAPDGSHTLVHTVDAALPAGAAFATVARLLARTAFAGAWPPLSLIHI